MRIFEFKQPVKKILETTLRKSSTSSQLSYLKSMLTIPSVSLGERGEVKKNLLLTPESKKEIEKIIQLYETKKISWTSIMNTVIKFTNGVEAPIGNIYKSAAFRSGGISVNKKYWNDGDIGEIFLGVALYVRFLSKDSITKEDFINEITSKSFEFSKQISNKTIQASGLRKSAPVALTINNKLLSIRAVNEYINHNARFKKVYPTAAKAIDKLLAGCIEYVNSAPRVQQALKEAEQSKFNPINIVSDGISNARESKADLQISVGKSVHLISLKVHTKKMQPIGQTSGRTIDVIRQFFIDFIPSINIEKLNKPWNPKTNQGWPDMSAAELAKLRSDPDPDLVQQVLKQVYKQTGEAYKIAKKQLDTELSKDPAEVISQLYDGIKKHAVGINDQQIMVILNPDSNTAWKELDFGAALAEALQSFNLTCELSIAGTAENSNHKLIINGTPIDKKAEMSMTQDFNADEDVAQVDSLNKKVTSNKSQLLFQLRSFQQNNGTQRNIVEMGPLLKSIAVVEKINELVDELANDFAD